MKEPKKRKINGGLEELREFVRAECAQRAPDLLDGIDDCDEGELVRRFWLAKERLF